MSKVSSGANFPPVAKWLGYGGVIPFVLLALAIATGFDLGTLGVNEQLGSSGASEKTAELIVALVKKSRAQTPDIAVS